MLEEWRTLVGRSKMAQLVESQERRQGTVWTGALGRVREESRGGEGRGGYSCSNLTRNKRVELLEPQ